MAKFVPMDISGIEPAEDVPSKESVISENPLLKSWNVDEAAGGVSSGIWESTSLSDEENTGCALLP
jgi:uncharacterized protein